MDEGTFENNFVWYEWTFVSPDDVPDDDLSAGRGVQQAERRSPSEDEPVWRT